jgi:Flp pilus assembly protein TadD
LQSQRRSFVLACIAIVAAAVPAWSQAGSTLPKPSRGALSGDTSNDSAQGSIHGRVVLPDGGPAAEAFRITLSVMRGTQAVLYTDQQGQFDFRNLPPAEYSIEVEAVDKKRFEPLRENVQVFRGSPSIVTLALKEKTDPKRTTNSRSVSVAEIDENVPAKARSEFDRGTKAAHDGKTAEAIAHLRRAIEYYPRFLIARNDLGALLLESGNLDDAEQELRSAIEIDSKAFNPTVNLGIVLVRKHDFVGAVRVLEQAAGFDPTSALARLYLGIALSNVEDFDRAESELNAAYKLGGREFALALFHLGRLYMQTGKSAAARNSFELYLHELPNADNSAEVKKLIAMLN